MFTHKPRTGDGRGDAAMAEEGKGDQLVENG